MSSLPLHRRRSIPRLGMALAWGALALLAYGAWDLAPQLAPSGEHALLLGWGLCLALLALIARKAR